MDQELGRLEDLPTDYIASLTAQNLVPLWPNLRGLIPPDKPRPKTVATQWTYTAIRPLLIKAGELTPIEKAERRVLILSNPGFGNDSVQATAAMYLGMQLLLPGEWAPPHRHTPNAVRMIVEGEGAYTTVNGEKCMMSRGDLILTPTGLWHEHGHDGDQPVIWLDVLDLPIVYYMEASYHVDGPAQAAVAARGDVLYGQGGVVPSVDFERAVSAYPMLRYPWAAARQTLVDLAASNPDLASVQVTYTSPNTGSHVQNILGFYAQMLRPGQSVKLPQRSPAMIFHVIEGALQVDVDGHVMTLAQADTCCAPGYSHVTLTNRLLDNPTFIFISDETPLHKKLGVFEHRGA